MDLNNTVIPAINKEDGPRIIAFYKKHGYKTSLKGADYKYNSSFYYYGVNNNKFSRFCNSILEGYGLKVLDILIINGELDIWI
jgi:hypothetical protein